MARTVADRANWTYAAVRPEPVPSSWKKGQEVRADCSKGVQFLCKWAGMLDPMRENYGPYGNSTTIWLNLKHISFSEQRVGDIVVFGPDKHACMIYEAGGDPTVWNMGEQGQPALKKLSQEIAGHPGVRYWLCQVAPPPKPSVKDELRAEKGFYAWVAWKLGEGQWKPYGPADPTVRPNVSRRIPLRWWLDYRKFLANREKGN